MRVILAEDSALLRDGLARLLTDEGHEIAASLGDAESLLDAVAAFRPDVVVVDVRMPPTHTDEGIRAALQIRELHADTGVLVLSQYVEKRYAVQLLTSDAARVGYLLKDRVAQVDEFLAALERVGNGGTVIDPEVVRQLLTSTNKSPLAKLTPRESDVLAKMAEGLTNTGIAERLFISQSAVEKHVNAIFDKLEFSNHSGYSRRVLAVLRYLSEG